MEPDTLSASDIGLELTLARLVPAGKSCGRRIGAMKGKLVLAEDFDAPLPDEMLDAFEGTHE